MSTKHAFEGMAHRPAELTHHFSSCLPGPVASIALSIFFGPPEAFPPEDLDSFTEFCALSKGKDLSLVLWQFLSAEIACLLKLDSPADRDMQRDCALDPVIAGLEVLCAGEKWDLAQEARAYAYELSLSWGRRIVNSSALPTCHDSSPEAKAEIKAMLVESHIALSAADAAAVAEMIAGGQPPESEGLADLVYWTINHMCICHARAAQAALVEDADSADAVLRSLSAMKQHRCVLLCRLSTLIEQSPTVDSLSTSS